MSESEKESMTVSKDSMIRVQAVVLFLLVGGIWALASEIADWRSRLESLEQAVGTRWTFLMERESWQEWARDNPGGERPDVEKIRANHQRNYP